MKVIVTYRNFHNIDRDEILPEIFSVKKNETAEECLKRIWTDQYNALLAESLLDNNDPLEKSGCWCKEDKAMLTWADGDTKEFYIIEAESYKQTTNSESFAGEDRMMGRLIDADAFIVSLKEYIDKPMTAGLCATLVELFPTAYDPYKVMEQLEENQVIEMFYDGRPPKQNISYDTAIAIVKRGGILDE